MQRILCILSFLVIILLNGCEKDQSIVPNEKTLIKSEKGLLCRGCGDWDLSDPTSTTEATTTNKQAGTDTAFVNSKRFRRDIPVIPTNSKEK
ncbi:hypothetical protein SAMN05421813_102230 [Daejeonella rubra]|uniref:Uncharacterized protein n=1 Tax=Daejeonella rubra TaxID=990371 RepID=A0A1G9N478_9SPHI|nr:hypothetical protein [Daejeonella rubra]SDL81356.1 hypothetical protein SAMN05421813_102230 [Daejeonella rubra]